MYDTINVFRYEVETEDMQSIYKDVVGLSSAPID